MNNLAIIPARSGSKGLQDKNIKNLNGRPLIAYSVKAAVDSGLFTSVMVSTDSTRYASIAKKCGAEVPFLRSEATSCDCASSWDVVEEVLCAYERIGKAFDTFCLLQPTSPLRTAEDVTNAYALFKKKKAIAVLSMTEMGHPLGWCGKIGESYSLENFQTRKDDLQRQKMEKYYCPNGAIYIVSVPEFRKDRFLYRAGSYAYIMPMERSVDIDTPFDFQFAEYLINKK